MKTQGNFKAHGTRMLLLDQSLFWQQHCRKNTLPCFLYNQHPSSLQQWAQEEDELGEDEFIFFPPSFPRSSGWHCDGLGARATPRPALFLVCAQKADNGD